MTVTPALWVPRFATTQVANPALTWSPLNGGVTRVAADKRTVTTAAARHMTPPSLGAGWRARIGILSKAEHTIRRRFIVASPFVAPPRLGPVSVVTEGAFEPIEQCTIRSRGRPSSCDVSNVRPTCLEALTTRRLPPAVSPCSPVGGGGVKGGSFPRGGAHDEATPRVNPLARGPFEGWQVDTGRPPK